MFCRLYLSFFSFQNVTRRFAPVTAIVEHPLFNNLYLKCQFTNRMKLFHYTGVILLAINLTNSVVQKIIRYYPLLIFILHLFSSYFNEILLFPFPGLSKITIPYLYIIHNIS